MLIVRSSSVISVQSWTYLKFSHAHCLIFIVNKRTHEFIIYAVNQRARVDNRPCARSGHMLRNKLCWNANNAVQLSNKVKSSWTGTSCFVLKVLLRYLRPSIIYSVPRDQIVQRAYLFS